MTSRAFRNLCIIEAMLAFATTLASPFISIYLFRSDLGIISIANYYGLCFAYTVLFCVMFVYLPVMNARRAISLSMAVLMLNYLGVWLLPPLWMYIICPVLYGLYVMWFWLPFNFLFCELTSKGDRGTTIGITFLIFPIIQLVMPIIAGLVVTTRGYNPLFIASAILLGITVFLPYFLLKGELGEVQERAKIDFRPFGGRLSAGLVLQGMQDGTFFFLIPLVSLTTTGGELGVGLAISVFAVGGAGGALVVARVSDRTGDRATWLRIGAIASVPLFLLVWAFPTLYVFMVCIGIAQFTTYIVSIFVMTMAVDKNELHKPTALLSRELLLELGRALGVVALVLTWMVWHDIFLGFVVAAITIGASAIAK